MLRVFRHWCSRRAVGVFGLEWVGLTAVSHATVSATAFLGVRGPVSAHPLFFAATWALVVQGCLYASDLYDLRVAALDRVRGARLLRAVGASLVVAAAVGALMSKASPGGALLACAGGAALGLLVLRAGLPLVLGAPARVLVVGDEEELRELMGDPESEGDGGFQVVGVLPAAGVEEAVHRLRADLVVVAAQDRRGAVSTDVLLRCRMRGVAVLDRSQLAERVMRRLPVRLLRPGDLVFSSGDFGQRGASAALKRAMDLGGAAVFALLSAPLMAAAAALVRWDSPGPISYRQERVGKAGRPFWITKFRTMRIDAESDGRPAWAGVGDGRVTRVGRALRKARIDELPQLLSVFKGDMSLVGPRPERPFFIALLKEQVPHFALREAVKPGITGWAQIRYPYGASVEDARKKLEYDLYYLKNWSPFLDLSNLFHTVRHVLFGKGAR
jgi:exopolysaccharide biosynthesis polyprenyl glycosylphosphotransferase